MRIFTALAATIAVASFSVAAQAAVYVKNSEITILVTNAEGHGMELKSGYTTLGDSHAISCDKDQGCLVTIQSMVGMSQAPGAWRICTLVDGQPVNPPCTNQIPAPGKDGGTGNALASVVISKGNHMFETGVMMNGIEGARLGNWEVHYTKLLDPPRGHPN
jgi:hypothetical protein